MLWILRGRQAVFPRRPRLEREGRFRFLLKAYPSVETALSSSEFFSPAHTFPFPIELHEPGSASGTEIFAEVSNSQIFGGTRIKEDNRSPSPQPVTP